jgi:EAL domain-containing protein (putative c-di-GMP-specific phosphodiesterase class I)
VGVALDDFGTGYSSLCYLRDFPLSKIKIDKSFVDKIGVQASAKAIIHAVIGLGHSMNIEVTAEGVETERQLEYLLDEGCDLIQGYLVGRPAPIDSFSALTGNVKRQDEFSYGANGRRRQARLVGRELNYTL